MSFPPLHTLGPTDDEATPAPTPTRPMLGVNKPAGDPDAPKDAETTAIAWFLLLIALAIGARLLLYFLGPAVDLTHAELADTARHTALAHNLVEFGEYGLIEPEPDTAYADVAILRAELGQLEPRTEHGLMPEVYTTPGYPLVLAGFEYVGIGLNLLLWIQIALSLGCVILAYIAFTPILRSQRLGLVVAAVVALHPAVVASSVALTPITFAMFLFLAGLALAATEYRRKIGTALIGGVLTGLCALFQPITLLAGPIVAVWILASERKLKAIPVAALFTIGSLAPAGAWMYHQNEAGFGYRFTGDAAVASLYGIAYPIAQATDAPAETEDGEAVAIAATPLDWLQQRMEPEEDVFAAMNRAAFESMTGQPVAFAQHSATRGAEFLTDDSMAALAGVLDMAYTEPDLGAELVARNWSLSGVEDRTGALLTLLWRALNTVLAVACPLGIVLLLWRRDWVPLLLLVGLSGYFLLASIGNPVEAARVPVIALFAALAVSGLMPAPVRQRRKKRSFKRRVAEQFDKDKGPDAKPAPSMGLSPMPSEPAPEPQSLRPI